MTEKQRQALYDDLLKLVNCENDVVSALCQSAVRNIKNKDSMDFAREALVKQDHIRETVSAAISLIWKHFPKNEAQPSG